MHLAQCRQILAALGCCTASVFFQLASPSLAPPHRACMATFVTFPSLKRTIFTSRSQGSHQTPPPSLPLPLPSSPPPPIPLPSVPEPVASGAGGGGGGRAPSALHLASSTYDRAPCGDGEAVKPQDGRSQASRSSVSRVGQAAVNRGTTSASSCAAKRGVEGRKNEGVV